MRIGINGMFCNQPATGSGQYTYYLLRALTQLDNAHEYLLLGARGADYDVMDGRLFAQVDMKARFLPLISSLRSAIPLQNAIPIASPNLYKVWFEQVAYPRACAAQRIDVAHVPYFAPPLFPRVPTAVTIHDLIPLVLPEYRKSVRVRLYTSLVAQAARRAAAVITDSKASARDITLLLGVPHHKLRVIYLAADEIYRPMTHAPRMRAVLDKYGVRSSYILYLGGFDVRKNLQTLLTAYAQVARQTRVPTPLVIAGKLPRGDTPFFPNPRRIAEELNIAAHVHCIGWVAEEDKPYLYSGAQLFVYPSIYEGFGLPPLEAMACGTPVVASNAASLPEIVENGGLLVDPTDADALATALHDLLTDEEKRYHYGRQAHLQAKKFRWRDTARKTFAVYQELGA